MQRVLQTFVDRLFESKNTEDLREGMSEMATAFNLRCFAYLSLPKSPNKAPALISSYPSDWTAYYLQQQYQLFDPVIIQALRRQSPFQWGLGLGLKTNSKREQAIFEEAAKFGIRCGFTVPVHDRRGATAAITFAADQRTSSFARTIDKHSRVLHLAALYFHAHVKRRFSSNRMIDGPRSHWWFKRTK